MIKIANIHNGEDFKSYEAQEFLKAFSKGTSAAWKTYERNMKKAHDQIEAVLRKEIDDMNMRIFQRKGRW